MSRLASLMANKALIVLFLTKVILLGYLALAAALALSVWSAQEGRYARELTACHVATDLDVVAVNQAAQLKLQANLTALTESSAKAGEREIINIMPWMHRFPGEDHNYWYREGLGTRAFRTCPESRCSIVNDTIEADAVLISHNYLDPNLRTAFQLPERASFEQKWIFYSWESPQHMDIKPEYKKLFNGTFTYMAKSDAHYPYGKIVTKEDVAASKAAEDEEEEEDWDAKKNVVWLVSHCESTGGREKYVEELAKYIDVTIYGKCGNNSCPTDDLKECKLYLQKRFKFFLSFENSLCLEYATEKLFGVMMTSMIPVTYGLYNYENNLPSNSYLDVRDFNSPQHLAERLNELSGNKTLFHSYMEWKQTSVANGNWFTPASCQLCEFLHKTRHDPPVTLDLGEFWNKIIMCVPKDQFLPSVGVAVARK